MAHPLQMSALTYGLPTGSLPDSELRQQISYAYLHMIATAAGCTLGDFKTDYDGIDTTIRSQCDYQTRPCPQIDVQLKCTTQATVVKATHVSWDLDGRKYELLRKRASNPRFLAILVLSKKAVNEWLEHHSTDQTTLLAQGTMYWEYGQSLPPFNSGQKSQVAKLPKSNIMNAVQLLRIMEHCGNGGYVAY